MFKDMLLGLVWIAIVLVPAIVASRLPLVSQDGYLDRYMDSDDQDKAGVEQGNSATNG